jgi:hypothetical protein
LVQVRGGAEFKTAGILTYFEDCKRGTNKEIGLKDFFEIASNTSVSKDLEDIKYLLFVISPLSSVLCK